MAKFLNPYSQVNTNTGGVKPNELFSAMAGVTDLTPSTDPTQVVVDSNALVNNDPNAPVNNAINPQINPQIDPYA